jgi:hypothetical protein
MKAHASGSGPREESLETAAKLKASALNVWRRTGRSETLRQYDAGYCRNEIGEIERQHEGGGVAIKPKSLAPGETGWWRKMKNGVEECGGV